MRRFGTSASAATSPRHCAAVAMAFGLLVATPASAQYIGRGAPPPLPAAPRPGQVETPAAALARSVRTLAQSPRHFPALISAGRAALDLGDMQAAIGFFGRAEEVRPSDPSPKIGMGAATVAGGDADGALRWFYQAQQLGATAAAIGADRGLAQDLLGNQAAAQVDYRAALAGPAADEARRRLALSLGISGDRTGAFSILQPLLMRRDPAAQRVRAFVLALVGDERGASSAIDAAMPGAGARMGGFFRLLPNLSAPQKAAAVHLGLFPDPNQVRVASVSPRLLAPVLPDRSVRHAEPQIVTAAPPPRAATVAPSPPIFAPAPSVTVAFPPPAGTTVAIPLGPPPVVSADVAVTPPAIVASPGSGPAAEPPKPGFAVSADAEPLKFDLPSARMAAAATATVPELTPPAATSTGEATVPAAGDRLSGIDRLLAQADELPVPSAPSPRFENVEKPVPAETASDKKAAERKKAATAKKAAEAKKTADAKKAADAKKLAESKKAAEEKRAAEAIGIAGTHWVQLAGGGNADYMDTEFRRLAKKSSALRGKGGAVTAGKDYFRLLTGPFPSKSAAQAFVNQLAKDDVDGFSWTRTPAQIKIEKISP